MIRSLLAFTIVFTLLATPASAMNCGQVLDDITKAISGHLTMSPENKAAHMRMALSGYDSCMVGDTKSASATRDMLMSQLRANLGAN